MKKSMAVWAAFFALALVQTVNAVETAIPCLDSTGAVKNADPANVCKALLPRCTDLKESLSKNLKNVLEWKIYGYYYLNKDIKLDKLSAQSGTPEGEDMPYPLCSVVGHKVSGDEAGEIDNQSIPGGKSCGEYPIIKNGSAWNYKTKIRYDGNQGKKWFSYVLGAYPWEIRRNAYDVLKQLKDDLSNVGEVIHSDAMTADVKGTLEMIKTATSKLSSESKNICNQPQEKNIVESCKTGALSVTDPVQKLCTLAKAQVALNDTAMPNMLVYEVMDRTKKMHEGLFGNLFSGDSNTHFKELIDHCAKNKSVLDKLENVLSPLGSTLKAAISANKVYSCNASCLTDGEEWYTNTATNDGISWKNESEHQKQRKCKKTSKYNLDNGHPQSSIITKIESEGWVKWIWNSGGWFDGENRNTAEEKLEEVLNLSNPTNSKGFAGMIESIIRRDICPQADHKKTGKNVCDDVGIKDKPAGK